MATLQEQLNQVKQKAQQVAQAVAGQSTSISPELQKEYQKLYGQPLTAGQVAGSVSGGMKTSSSFEVISNIAKSIFPEISGGAETGIEDTIKNYIQTLSKSPQDIQNSIQEGKNALMAQKEATVGSLREELNTLTRGELSKLGLEAGVGSGQIEAYENLVRKNLLAINQLSAQYDTAIANLDLQTASAIRDELNNLINLQLNLEQNKRALMGQAINIASSIYQNEINAMQSTLSSLVESNSWKKWENLDKNTQESIVNTASKLESYLGVPSGALVSAYKNQINNPKASQILQYSLPNGEFGYYVLDQNGNLIKKQIVGTAVSSGLDISTQSGKESYAAKISSDFLSKMLKQKAIDTIKQEAQRAIDNANKIYGTNLKIDDFINDVKDNNGNVIDLELKDFSSYVASPRKYKAIESVLPIINNAIQSSVNVKLNPDEAFQVYNNLFVNYLNPLGISSKDEGVERRILESLSNFVNFNEQPKTTGGGIIKSELFSTYKDIENILQQRTNQ